MYVVDVAAAEEDAQDLIFARIVSKLREHLERRDLGVKHVVVFVDELNKYAPGDGPDTYVRKMLLDIAERGRYLGLVLFSAQQFRSQVHRRVVGNSGTALFGRMDMDELATPGYAVLSPATRTKLATLEKGQLMVRHPHFTQPIFVRFPRPAVMRGRDGVERFPQAAESRSRRRSARSLRQLDPSVRSPGCRTSSRCTRRPRSCARATRRCRRGPRDVQGILRVPVAQRSSRRSRPPRPSPARRCGRCRATTRTASDRRDCGSSRRVGCADRARRPRVAARRAGAERAARAQAEGGRHAPPAPRAGDRDAAASARCAAPTPTMTMRSSTA